MSEINRFPVRSDAFYSEERRADTRIVAYIVKLEPVGSNCKKSPCVEHTARNGYNQ